MTINQRIVTFFLVIFACFFGISTFVMPGVFALPNPENIAFQTATPYQTSEQYNQEYNVIPGNPSQETETGINNFAWKTFMALNWPADPKCNGDAADTNFGDDPNSPRVWECYQAATPAYVPHRDTEITQTFEGSDFLNDPRSSPIELRFGEDAKGIRLAKFFNQEEFHPRFPLVDQSGNYVLNEIRISPAEVKQIIDNGWTSSSAFEKYTDDKDFTLICSRGSTNIFEGQFPCLENVEIPEAGLPNEGLPGAIEIKAAWMVLQSPAADETTTNSCQPLEFTGYKTTRTFQNLEDGNSITVPLGLVGFHIMQKTSNHGWVWSTFEHDNNAPDRGSTVLPDGEYNFFGSKCAEYRGEECQENQPYVEFPYNWSNECPHAVTASGQPQIPSQITRVIPILDSAEQANQAWHDTIRNTICSGDPTCASTWTKYKLVGTQWIEAPSNPYSQYVYVLPPRNDDVNGDGDRTSKLANVALEPYIQAHPKLNGQSCVKCHQDARLPNSLKTRADFSFLFEDGIAETLDKLKKGQ